MTFSYDGYGNIDSKSEYAYTLGELGAILDTVDYEYDEVWKDKLTSYDGQGITYDAIGNPTNYMGATMTWNGRQLMSYSKDGTNVSYTYDGDGLRTSKTVNGVKHNYYYVDGVLMYEKNDVYDYYYRYDQDGRLAMIIRRRLSDNYKWYYYIVSNTRGDIMEIHNGQGQITAKYNYDAWGKLISITNANGTPLADGSFAHLVSVRYRGYYYDTETGFYYLQSRYYDPETGRFLNADDEYILNSSLIIKFFQDINKNLSIDLKNTFSLKSSYSKSAVENKYESIGDAIEAYVWLPIAMNLYEKHDIPLRYLTYGTVEIDAQIFYEVEKTKDAVIKVTILAKGEKSYDSLTSGYYQTIYETVFYTGKFRAWNLYVSNSLATRQKEYTLGSLILTLASTIIGFASIFNPKSALFKLAAALDTSVGVSSGVYDSLGWFALARIAKFDNYVLSLLNENPDAEEISFLFSIINKSIEYANQKGDIIYMVDLNK